MILQQNFFRKGFLTAVLVFLCFGLTYAQSSGQATQTKEASKTTRIKNWVDSQNYVFKARSAQPMSGNTRQLTSEYDLTVTKTVIDCYLPYFGRAYAAPIDPSQGGIKFSSKDFTYQATPKKKGGWDVLIKPKDARDVQQMSLSISENGYASLQVTSTNRQPISFSGVIAPVKVKK